MFIKDLKILKHHDSQFIPDVSKVTVPGIFRGRPEINNSKIDEATAAEICPTNAISSMPLSIDLGKCVFCGECALTFPDKIKFTNDYKLATNDRKALIISEGNFSEIKLDPELVRKEINSLFGRSLKLREVSAAGDNSHELELNACANVNFDMGRWGIEFVASPRHADGIVITGPISENMSEALQICYNAIPSPKLIVLNGTDAISGGIFSGSKALNRSFIDKYKVDLYVPGNPPHPLTFINGILELTRKKFRK